MILEKDENEYILIYSFYNDNSNLSVNKINNIEKFHIVSNIIPEIDISSNFPKIPKSMMIKTLVNSCNQPEYGYQIFSFIGQTVIGVMEGPPNPPYENGSFLFKFCINENLSHKKNVYFKHINKVIYNKVQNLIDYFKVNK